MDPSKPTMATNQGQQETTNNPVSIKSSKIHLNDRSNGKPLRVLSEEDWQFWIREGYVIISQAIPMQQVQQLVDFLWEFEEKDPDQPETWHAPPRAEMEMKELIGSGMVEVYNHQYLWDNRQTKRVYDAFVDIWGIEQLWVTIDRANLNVPLRPQDTFKGFIHWDLDPDTGPQNVQGVLALNDQTDENMGGFQCIPELYRNYDSWKRSQPADRNHFQPDISGLEDNIVKVKLRAGDLLIFNSTLPHGIRANRSKNKVRLAQYISMMPAEEDNESLRNWRVNSWKHRIAPQGYAFPGDPRQWEQKKYETAQLSELGERLLGLKKWH
ncbi:MAG: phytanoyl-CoA dioxygenase [Saprospiraceae bacterium]|nr:MAG: phytanoyl-CoA dioxygenase [Saprospiraceae bacterium]